MSDTPIFDQLLSEQEQHRCPPEDATEPDPPPEPEPGEPAWPSPPPS